MRTVLYVLGAAELGGAERVLLNLIGALDRDRVRPVVAVAADGPVVRMLEHAGAEVARVPAFGRVRDVHRVPAAVRALARLIRERDVDLVHANGEKVSIYAGLAARVAGCPCVFWLHDAPGAGTARAVQGIMARTPHAAAVTCSAWMADAFEARYQGVRAFPILNGVLEADVLRAARADLGWPGDALVATFAGRLQRWKGPDVFVRAAAEAARADRRVRFLVMGGALFGRERAFAESLPALAADLGLGDRIRFTGHRDDALDLIAASDIVVHASVAPEPFAMVVAEAMMLGKPVIATTVGGPQEMIVDGEHGLLLPPADPSALAAAIASLAGDAALRVRLGRAARARAREHLSAERMAREFESLYERIAS